MHSFKIGNSGCIGKSTHIVALLSALHTHGTNLGSACSEMSSAANGSTEIERPISHVLVLQIQRYRNRYKCRGR